MEEYTLEETETMISDDIFTLKTVLTPARTGIHCIWRRLSVKIVEDKQSASVSGVELCKSSFVRK